MTKPDPNLPTMDLAPDWVGPVLAQVAALSTDVVDSFDLGPDHAAYFTGTSPVLAVIFAKASGKGTLPALARAALEQGWSLLLVLARRDDWFLAPQVDAFLQEQSAAEFFDGFERVLFAGAGMGGYASCLQAVHVPGARVLAIAPHATLDPALVPWDRRFPQARRLDFSARFAPRGLDVALQARILFDPLRPLDAGHAGLFRAPHIQSLCVPFRGLKTAKALARMGLLGPILQAAVEDRLDPVSFAKLARMRRKDAAYLRRLAVDAGTPRRSYVVAKAACSVGTDPQMRKLMSRAQKALDRQRAL